MAASAVETSAPRKASRLRSFFELLKSLWAVVGIVLLMMLTVEYLLERLFSQAQVYSPESFAASFQGTDAAILGDFTREMQEAATPARHLAWEPFSYWRLSPFEGKYVSIDERGLRKTWAPPAQAGSARPVKLFFFGASVMWGQGARDAFTIPSLVARRLSEQGVAVEPTSFAQLGFVSTQSVIELLRQLQRGNVPDAIVVMDGFNDMAATYINMAVGESIFEAERRREFRLTQRPALSLVRYALSNTALGRLGRPDQSADGLQMVAGKRPSKSQMAQQSIVAWQANLRAIEGLSRSYGFAVVYGWQPTLFTKQKPSPQEQAALENTEKLQQLYAPFYALARQIFANSPHKQDAAAPHLIYLGELFNTPTWDEQTAFADRFHLTEKANAAVADRFVAELQPIFAQRHLAKTKRAE